MTATPRRFLVLLAALACTRVVPSRAIDAGVSIAIPGAIPGDVVVEIAGAASPDGTSHVAWSVQRFVGEQPTSARVYYTRMSASGWDEVTQLFDADAGGIEVWPLSLAVASEERVAVAWGLGPSPWDAGGPFSAWGRGLDGTSGGTSGGTWGPVEQFSATGARVTVASADSANFVSVWGELNGSTLSRRWTPAEGWGGTAELAQPAGGWRMSPAAAGDGAGRVVAAWNASFGSISVRWYADGGWLPPASVNAGGMILSDVEVAAAEGRAAVVFERLSQGKGEVRSAACVVDGACGAATLLGSHELGASGEPTEFRVAAAQSGDVAVVWHSEGAGFFAAAILGDAGTDADSVVQLTPPGETWEMTVATAGPGRFATALSLIGAIQVASFDARAWSHYDAGSGWQTVSSIPISGPPPTVFLLPSGSSLLLLFQDKGSLRGYYLQ